MDKIIDILDSIAYEKGLKITDVENALKEALIKTAQKMVDFSLVFDAEIDKENKELKLFQKIEVVPARVNLKLFDWKQYEKVNLHKDLNIGVEKKIFIFVGRLVEGKGVKYLIKALNNIKKEEYHLLIIGDGDEKNNLQHLVNRLELQDEISFLGKIEFRKIPYYFAGANFFIFPTLNEGFGRVVLESMAMKTLVIASRVGGIQDIIKDKETGFFTKTANSNDIEKTIKKVLNMKSDDADYIIENSYKTVIKHYEFNVVMNDFIKLYDGVIHDYENS